MLYLGAPELTINGRMESAVIRLISAIEAFNHYEGALKEHFAYGKLNRQEYALAHTMHINQHLSEIELI